MSFGKKTGRAAFFADLGREVVRLAESPSTFINPICIGKDVPICPKGGLTCMADIYVTPGGSVALSFTDLYDEDIDALQCCSGALRSWSHETLDDISTDFFFDTEGQGALVIDIMARMGFMGYSSKGSFYSAIDRTLAGGDFLMVVGDFPFRSVRYSRRQFIDDFCAIRGIDSDDMTSFICELETVDGVAAAVLGSDLVVSYSPIGNKTSIPLFYFTLSPSRSDLCVSPRRLRYALEKNNLPLSAGDSLFDFFAHFADMGRVKPSPEDGSIGLLYLMPEALFRKVSRLVEMIREFSRAVS